MSGCSDCREEAGRARAGRLLCSWVVMDAENSGSAVDAQGKASLGKRILSPVLQDVKKEVTLGARAFQVEGTVHSKVWRQESELEAVFFPL